LRNVENGKENNYITTCENESQNTYLQHTPRDRLILTYTVIKKVVLKMHETRRNSKKRNWKPDR